jgi:hypothetical protein
MAVRALVKPDGSVNGFRERPTDAPVRLARGRASRVPQPPPLLRFDLQHAPAARSLPGTSLPVRGTRLRSRLAVAVLVSPRPRSYPGGARVTPLWTTRQVTSGAPVGHAPTLPVSLPVAEEGAAELASPSGASARTATMAWRWRGSSATSPSLPCSSRWLICAAAASESTRPSAISVATSDLASSRLTGTPHNHMAGTIRGAPSRSRPSARRKIPRSQGNVPPDGRWCARSMTADAHTACFLPRRQRERGGREPVATIPAQPLQVSSAGGSQARPCFVV